MHQQIRRLKLCCLIGTVALLLGQANVVYAQTSGPSWIYTGAINVERSWYTATLLPSGKVLVAGGSNSRTGLLRNTELYDPASGTWSVTGGLNTPRQFHTATLLKTGKVLVAGGFNGDYLTSAEVYDPITGLWTFTSNLNTPRADHKATLLQNGNVLIVGGDASCGFNTAELYDPETRTWSATGTLLTRTGCSFGDTATLLQNGKVLVVGGAVDDDDDPSCCVFSRAELYDPASGSWSLTGSLNSARFTHTATLLRNGTVLVAGGSYVNSAELYDPVTGRWSYTGNMKSSRGYHTATLLPSGYVLVAGGAANGNQDLNAAEIYNPSTGNWSDTASLNAMRFRHTATLLENGKVLVTGGFDVRGVLQSAELYDSGVEVTPNPVDDSLFFVRQHYLDFLNREPEAEGIEAWLRVLRDCPVGDDVCLHQARLITSAGFFGSPEFQLKGYFVFRFYRLAFDRLPAFEEITPDLQTVTGQTSQEVFTRKAAFVNSFVQRQEFVNTYGGLSNTAFVSSLLGRYQLDGITTPDPTNPDGNVKVLLRESDLTLGLNTGTLTHGQVLRAIAESNEVFGAEFNRAFVAMQYYGYLRRTPEPEGFQSWLNYLNAHPTDFLEMVRGFVDSREYRARFGPP